MPVKPEMVNSKVGQLSSNFPFFVYFFATLFMVFFSVQAVQKWPGFWAQGAIPLACILPAIAVFFKVRPDLVGNKKWPSEIKFILIIVVLGLLNICFSEDQPASFKGMGLFLMSGILVFASSYFLLDTRWAQKGFFYLCSFCFVVLLIFGAFEAVLQFNAPGKRILLLSSNPIPAGSLLILLSIGPLILVVQAQYRWKKIFWTSCLLAGILLIVLIAQRGPVLALAVMGFVGLMKCRKRIWILTLAAFVFIGIGSQFVDKIPLQYKSQLLKMETVFVRMEFYHIAIDVLREKPVFGLGFNSSLSRFIPYDYEDKIYPKGGRYTFYTFTNGIRVFDNMFLSFLGEMGGLFTLAYIGLVAHILTGITMYGKVNANLQWHVSLLLIVMAGFLAHSLTYDSLKYPHLNWMFHSLLGLMARSHVFGQTEND